MVFERGSPWRTKEEGSLLLGSVLWSADRLRLPLVALGVDYRAFRELLRVRILLDLRPASAGASSFGIAGVVLVVLTTWLAGLLTGIAALLSPDAATWVVVSQSVLLVLLGYVLFAQLAGLLVDPTDIGVVAPHPVSDRTVFAVRLVEVLAHVLLFVVSFTAGNVFLAVFKKPPLAVLFVYPLLSLLCGLTTLGGVTLLFAGCLRLVGPARFQRVTMWVQILGGVGFIALMQLPSRIPDEHWDSLSERLRGLRFLWPPFQYAELFGLASGATGAAAGPAVVALLTPVAALVATFWLASRYFVAGLQGTLSAPGKSRASWASGPLGALGRRLSASREERAGFDFARALSSREPHYLRGVLPQLAMFQIMSLGMGFGRHGSAGLFLPMSAGMLFMALPNVLMLSQGTPTPEACWLFDSAPLEREAALLRGGVKALLVQWFGLPAALLFCLQLTIAGPAALPRIALAFGLAFAFALLFTGLFQLGIPFTRAIRFGASGGGGNLGIILLMGFGLALLAGIHVLLSLHPLSLGAGIAASAVAVVLLWRRLDGLRVARDGRLAQEGGKPGEAASRISRADQRPPDDP